MHSKFNLVLRLLISSTVVTLGFLVCYRLGITDQGSGQVRAFDIVLPILVLCHHFILKFWVKHWRLTLAECLAITLEIGLGIYFLASVAIPVAISMDVPDVSWTTLCIFAFMMVVCLAVVFFHHTWMLWSMGKMTSIYSLATRQEASHRMIQLFFGPSVFKERYRMEKTWSRIARGLVSVSLLIVFGSVTYDLLLVQPLKPDGGLLHVTEYIETSNFQTWSTDLGGIPWVLEVESLLYDTKSLANALEVSVISSNRGPATPTLLEPPSVQQCQPDITNVRVSYRNCFLPIPLDFDALFDGSAFDREERLRAILTTGEILIQANFSAVTLVQDVLPAAQLIQTSPISSAEGSSASPSFDNGAPALLESQRGVKIWLGLEQLVGDTVTSSSDAVPIVPFPFLPGVHLWATLAVVRRRVFTNTNLAAFGFQKFQDLYGIRIDTLFQNPNPPIQGENVSSLKFYIPPLSEVSGTNTVIQDVKDFTVLDGASLLGGFWTFINGAFALIFGSSLLLVLFGFKPLSIYGVVHILQRSRVSLAEGYSLTPEEQAHTVAVLREHLMDAGDPDSKVEGRLESHPTGLTNSCRSLMSECRDPSDMLEAGFQDSSLTDLVGGRGGTINFYRGISRASESTRHSL